jgi:signal peptidase I
MKEQLKAAFTSWPHCLATYVALAGAFWLLAFGWKPVLNNPPVYTGIVAVGEGEKAWKVSFTGSMKPFLRGGEIAVTKADYDSIQVGQILVYKASYNNNPIIHRAVQKDRDGWIMSGDSAKHTESWARVNKDNYLGTVVAVYQNLDKK